MLSTSDGRERRLSAGPAGRRELGLQVVQVGGTAGDTGGRGTEAEERRASEVIGGGESAPQTGGMDVRVWSRRRRRGVRGERELSRGGEPPMLLRTSPAFRGPD